MVSLEKPQYTTSRIWLAANVAVRRAGVRPRRLLGVLLDLSCVRLVVKALLLGFLKALAALIGDGASINKIARPDRYLNS